MANLNCYKYNETICFLFVKWFSMEIPNYALATKTYAVANAKQIYQNVQMYLPMKADERTICCLA